MSVKRIAGRLRKGWRRCYCGVTFLPLRRNQKHCSPQCRSRQAQRKWRQKAQDALQQVAS